MGTVRTVNRGKIVCGQCNTELAGKPHISLGARAKNKSRLCLTCFTPLLAKYPDARGVARLQMAVNDGIQMLSPRSTAITADKIAQALKDGSITLEDLRRLRESFYYSDTD